MRRPSLVWFGLLGSLTALDIWCDRNATTGDSLSECLRAAFRAHTPAGRALIVGGWAALTAWFLPHLCRNPKET
ncbi:MAG: hypothetical protein ACXVXP_00015 [Mycobacteriaceae bacterium]